MKDQMKTKEKPGSYLAKVGSSGKQVRPLKSDKCLTIGETKELP